MAATNFIPLQNSAAEVSAIGRVTHKGLRFQPASGTRQAVLNMRVMFRRSYKATQEATEWTEVKSYIDYALWGARAENAKKTLEKFGAFETLTDGHEIRVKVSFSMTDYKIGAPWGDDKRQDLTFKASAIEIISITESNFAPRTEGPVEEEPVTEVEF